LHFSICKTIIKEMPITTDHLIARRLKAFREERGLTQADLAERMGFANRQTLTSIEAGERAISAEEMVQAAEALDVELSDFTDPFRLIGEGEFSFRAAGVSSDVLDGFERTARQWVATYRTLLERAGVPRSHLGSKLELREDSTFEAAQEAAEELRREWKMGDVPAEVLVDVIERELGARVLFVDAPKDISGAAVHLPGLLTILVNRRESLGRRHFDIAHELFHLLTWDAMKPDRVEPQETPRGKGNRVETLADNFAGALLMPGDVVRRRWDQRGEVELHDWLNAVATSMRVTSIALKWRMVVLGLLSKAEAEAVDDRRLAANGGQESDATPLLFGREFIARVHGAVEEGHLSLRRAVQLLGMTARDFSDLCIAYGVALSYEV
jgi:Zn-dependent peptidase ImmA (M78 family)/DNA-binding XRE family transcriptional regulator